MMGLTCAALRTAQADQAKMMKRQLLKFMPLWVLWDHFDDHESVGQRLDWHLPLIVFSILGTKVLANRYMQLHCSKYYSRRLVSRLGGALRKSVTEAGGFFLIAGIALGSSAERMLFAFASPKSQ